MLIKTSSGFADGDLSYLKRLLELIDEELDSIQHAIRKSADPETDGLLDRGEYLAGIEFAAIQQYIVGTYAQFKISKAEAFNYHLAQAWECHSLPHSTPEQTFGSIKTNGVFVQW